MAEFEKSRMTVGLQENIASKTHHRETADDYSKVLLRMGRFRVADCRDGIQWLYQRQRHRFSSGGTAWDTLGYCTTRKALIHLHRQHTGSEGKEIARSLPEKYRRGSKSSAD